MMMGKIMKNFTIQNLTHKYNILPIVTGNSIIMSNKSFLFSKIPASALGSSEFNYFVF